MLTLTVPILRCFDLLVFGYEAGVLDLKDSNNARSELLKCNEGLPKPFQHASFEDGMNKFSARLFGGAPAANPSTDASYSSRLFISRI
jgi:hypothetical protein